MWTSGPPEAGRCSIRVGPSAEGSVDGEAIEAASPSDLLNAGLRAVRRGVRSVPVGVVRRTVGAHAVFVTDLSGAGLVAGPTGAGPVRHGRQRASVERGAGEDVVLVARDGGALFIKGGGGVEVVHATLLMQVGQVVGDLHPLH